MINYAIIGTGWITETFIAGATERSELRLAGVYSRSEEKGRAFADKNRAGAKGGEIRVYTDLEELARDTDIEAVYIASPNSLHVCQSRQMLEAGKHVICEKPIAIHPEDLRELQALAAEKNLVYMEAIMMLHQPQLAPLKQAVARLGRIRTGHVDFSQLSSKYKAYREGKNPNIFNPRFCTGALEDLGIYCIYFVLEVFGQPESFRVTPQFMESGADCSGEVILLYPDKNITVTYCKVGQNRLGSQIMGDEGTLTVESISQLTGMTLYDTAGIPENVWGQEEKNYLMGAEASDFALFIRDRNAEASRTLGGLDLDTCNRRAVEVCDLMAAIREQADIRFIEE